MTFKKKGRPYKDKNINEISNSLGEKLRLLEPTEEEHKDFQRRMKKVIAQHNKQKTVDEIADNLGRKLRQGETISKQEHNEFYKSMKEHLQNLKK